MLRIMQFVSGLNENMDSPGRFPNNKCKPRANYRRPRCFSIWISSKPTSRAWRRTSQGAGKLCGRMPKRINAWRSPAARSPRERSACASRRLPEAELMAKAGHYRAAADLARRRSVEDRAHRQDRRDGGGRSCAASDLVSGSGCTRRIRKVDILVDLDVGDHRTGASSLGQAACYRGNGGSIQPSCDLRGLQAYSVHGSHGSGPEERVRVSAESFARSPWRCATQWRAKGLSHRDPDGRQHRDMEHRHGSSGADRIAGGLLRVHGHGVPARGPGFRAGADGAGDGGERQSCGLGQYGCRDEGLRHRSRLWTGARVSCADLKYRWGGDEFGYLEPDGAALPESRTTLSTAVRSLPGLGEKIEMVPPHCDPTVNLYDTIYACRGDRVEAAWPLKRL